MGGTVRTFDETMREDIRARLKRTAELIAESAGVAAEVAVTPQYPVTSSEPNLTQRIVPALERVAGPTNVRLGTKLMASEDFSFFGREIPGAYFVVGCTPKDAELDRAEPNHSPRFYVDESCLLLGVPRHG
jgi:metal-dependent amidase/aminoacylase/carboxypeptidase family protein